VSLSSGSSGEMHGEARDQLLELLIMLGFGIRSYILAVKIVIDEVVRHVDMDKKSLTFRDIFRGDNES
jgi:hypothetical protein